MANKKDITAADVKGRAIILGVDPSMNRCALAAACGITGQIISVATYDFWDAYQTVRLLRLEAGSLETFVENPAAHGFLYGRWQAMLTQRKAKSLDRRDLSTMEKMLLDIGKNHGAALLLMRGLERSGITVHAVKPVKRKLNAQVFQSLTKFEGSTNQDERDAAMLVYGRKSKR